MPGDSAGSHVPLIIDYAANARTQALNVIECQSVDQFVAVIKNDRYVVVPGYESWWDVAVAEMCKLLVLTIQINALVGVNMIGVGKTNISGLAKMRRIATIKSNQNF